LQCAILRHRLDDELRPGEGVHSRCGMKRGVELVERTSEGSALERTTEVLADTGSRGIRQRGIAFDHDDLGTGEEERVGDAAAHAAASEYADAWFRRGHFFLRSRNARMRRSFSGLSKSSACSSRSIAGWASAGARSARLVYAVASGSFCAMRSAMACAASS